MGRQCIFRLLGQLVTQGADNKAGIGQLPFHCIKLRLLRREGGVQFFDAFFLKKCQLLQPGEPVFKHVGHDCSPVFRLGVRGREILLFWGRGHCPGRFFHLLRVLLREADVALPCAWNGLALRDGRAGLFPGCGRCPPCVPSCCRCGAFRRAPAPGQYVCPL